MANNNEILLQLDIASHLAAEKKNRELRKVGLSGSHMQVLQLINDSEEKRVTPSHIAMKISRERHDVTTLLYRMDRAGLVNCKMNPKDRRSIFVYMTERGQRLFTQGTEIMKRYTEDITRGITLTRLENFRKTLNIIQKNSIRNR